MIYNANQEYEIKYIDKKGKTHTTTFTPEVNVTKPQLITKLKEQDNSFFKLLNESKTLKKEANVNVINPDEAGYYDNNIMQVNIWSGAGYTLDTFYLYCTEAQEALEKVVAYCEETNNTSVLMDVSETLKEVVTDWENEYKEFRENAGILGEEDGDNDSLIMEFCTEYLNLVYVDATEEGATKPYFIRGENLMIKDMDKITEDVDDFEEIEDVDAIETIEEVPVEAEIDTDYVDMVDADEVASAVETEVVGAVASVENPTAEEVSATEQVNGAMGIVLTNQEAQVDMFQQLLNQAKGQLPEAMYNVLEKEVQEIMECEVDCAEALASLKAAFHLQDVSNNVAELNEEVTTNRNKLGIHFNSQYDLEILFDALQNAMNKAGINDAEFDWGAKDDGNQDVTIIFTEPKNKDMVDVYMAIEDGLADFGIIDDYTFDWSKTRNLKMEDKEETFTVKEPEELAGTYNKVQVAKLYDEKIDKKEYPTLEDWLNDMKKMDLVESANIREITPVEKKILNTIKTVGDYSLDNIQIETTPEGATHIMTLGGNDIVTIEPLTDEEKEELRLNGYYKMQESVNDDNYSQIRRAIYDLQDTELYKGFDYEVLSRAEELDLVDKITFEKIREITEKIMNTDYLWEEINSFIDDSIREVAGVELEESVETDLAIEPGSAEEAQLDEIQGTNLREKFMALTKEQRKEYLDTVTEEPQEIDPEMINDLADYYKLDADILYWCQNIVNRDELEAMCK